MKKSLAVMLSLSALGTSFFVTHGTTATASSMGRGPAALANRGSSRAHVPQPGSAERKAIAEAMRKDIKKISGITAIFVFKHLKANGAWAYAIANPQSPDGRNHYEPVAALLHRRGSKWTIAGHLLAEEVPEKAALRNLRRKFPQAPSDIFPHR